MIQLNFFTEISSVGNLQKIFFNQDLANFVLATILRFRFWLSTVYQDKQRKHLKGFQ